MNIVRQVRSLTGLTPHALARKIGTPVTEVEAWEAGVSNPPPNALAVFQALLARTKLEDSNHPRQPKLESQVICADSIEYLQQIPDESVEMILSDIPYGIGLDDWDVLHANTNSAYMGSSAAQERAGKVFGKRRKPINGWSSADRTIPREYQDWCSKWTSEWLRVLRPGGSAIVFAGRRLAHRCVAALEDAGFNLRDILAWIRPNAAFRAQRLSIIYQKRGDLAQAQRWNGWRVGNLRPVFEPIIWCFKPYAVTIADNMLEHQVGAYNFSQFECSTGHQNNTLEFGLESAEKGYHEAQKPVKLLQTLIELCTTPNQLVLDPFAGSGSTAVAAQNCNRHFIAIEINPELCEICRSRLAKERNLG